MKQKTLVIFIDRDGTLVFDKKYHLGHQRNWKKLVKFLPGVVQGLKSLRKIPEAKIYMVTNQAGVSIKEFPLLTEKKAHDVCHYILNLFEKKGFTFDGYQMCGKADTKYLKSHPQFTFDKKLVGNFPCRKPNPGMINSLLRKDRLNKKDAKIYVIGDRVSDVKTGLNAGGIGIMIPFRNEPGEAEKCRALGDKNRVFAVKRFSEAVNFILRNEKIKK